MRIRKNAKLRQILPQSHVCQLNQSPWDVISFGNTSDQLQVEDSFTGTGSRGDSVGAVESVVSMMDGSTKLDDSSIRNEHENKELDDNEVKRMIGLNKGTKKKLYCQKNDGKSWQCKKEAKEGHSFCDYHFNLHRSYTISPEPPTGGRRARPSRLAKNSAAGCSNPYEFYYYSGFGPLWGKRRGVRGGAEGCKIAEQEARNQSNISSPSSSETDNQKFDHLDEEDDDEDDNNGDSGKKRMRRPVKARSLKSLM